MIKFIDLARSDVSPDSDFYKSFDASYDEAKRILVERQRMLMKYKLECSLLTSRINMLEMTKRLTKQEEIDRIRKSEKYLMFEENMRNVRRMLKLSGNSTQY